MEIVALKMLVIVSVSAAFGKHIYVGHKLSWPSARDYCTSHYTDLAIITTSWEEKKVENATGWKAVGPIWIGLAQHDEVWEWVGATPATYIPWSWGEYDDNDPYASICWRQCGQTYGWYNTDGNLPFICLNLKVVEKRGNWEEALDYCRDKHTILTSLVSEAENKLATRDVQLEKISERVWMGLRFLGGRWLWVNGDPLMYQAWSVGDEDHHCPTLNRCGALTKEGVWESVDCQERLSFICY